MPHPCHFQSVRRSMTFPPLISPDPKAPRSMRQPVWFKSLTCKPPPRRGYRDIPRKGPTTGYRGYSKLRTHPAIGPYGKSNLGAQDLPRVGVCP